MGESFARIYRSTLSARGQATKWTASQTTSLVSIRVMSTVGGLQPVLGLLHE